MKSLFSDSFIIHKPLHVVSGDCYFVTEVKDTLVICAIDCTGHGVPGSLMSMVALNLLERVVNLYEITRPSMILHKMHEEVVKALKQDITGIEDGMDISICSFDKKNKVLDFAGASRPLVYIKDGELNYVKGQNRSIGGMLDERRDYQDYTIKLDSEVKFYLFSDGYADQHGGENNQRFMIKRLRELLFDTLSETMLDQKNKLEEKFNEWKGEEEQTDDVLLMGFELKV